MAKLHGEMVGGYHIEEWELEETMKFIVLRDNYGIAKFKSLDDAKEYMNFKLDKDESAKIAKREFQVHRSSPTMKVMGLNFEVKLFNDRVAAFATEQEAIKFAKDRNKSVGEA